MKLPPLEGIDKGAARVGVYTGAILGISGVVYLTGNIASFLIDSIDPYKINALVLGIASLVLLQYPAWCYRKPVRWACVIAFAFQSVELSWYTVAPAMLAATNGSKIDSEAFQPYTWSILAFLISVFLFAHAMMVRQDLLYGVLERFIEPIPISGPNPKVDAVASDTSTGESAVS